MTPAKSFDPYHKWLGIAPKDQPPTHYRLLGLDMFESDPDVIESAADRQMAHLRLAQIGPHAALSQQLLNEVAAAKRCLLSADEKAAYDESLRASQRPASPEPAAPGPALAMPAEAPEAPLAASSVRPAHYQKAAPVVRASPVDSLAQRPLWQEPIVFGSAIVGLLIGTATVAIMLLKFLPARIEEAPVAEFVPGNDAQLAPVPPQAEAGTTPSVPVTQADLLLPPVYDSSNEPQGGGDPTDNAETLASREAPDRPAQAPPNATMQDFRAPASESPTESPPAGEPERSANPAPAGGADNGATALPVSPSEKQTPPDPGIRVEYQPIGKPIDLLRRIVPSRDAVHGEWRLERGALVSPNGLNWARLQLPTDAPPEYLLTVEFSRPAGNENLSLGLVAGGSQFMYCVAAFAKGGLFLLDGKEWHVNETSYPADDIFRSGPNTITCIVYQSGIIGRVNDRTLLDWEGDFDRLSLQSLWQVPSPQSLFLGTGPRYEFTKVEIQPIRSQSARNRRRR